MNGDVVEVADALGDQLYILAGTMMRHGMQDVIAKVFREIQASNMSKLGSDGAPILREDGKVMKGPNYFRPNIAGILEADAMERADAPASAPLDKLAWSVCNAPAPLDRLAHTELGTETVEAEEEAEDSISLQHRPATDPTCKGTPAAIGRGMFRRSAKVGAAQ